MAASPLQIAVMAAVAVNGGYRVQPHLVKDRSAQVSREFLGLQPSTLELLRSALQPRTSSLPVPEASQPPNRPPQPNVPIGWSATHSLVQQSNQPIGAWAVAAGPANDPKIVVVTFVEQPSDRPLAPVDPAVAPSNGAMSQEPSAPAAQAAEQIAGATVVNYVQSLDRWLP
jgi:penicillin-binding protein 2